MDKRTPLIYEQTLHNGAIGEQTLHDGAIGEQTLHDGDVDERALHYGFVMEQTLGHVTHYKNLRAAVDAAPGVRASWFPLAFAPRGALETLPVVRNNWTLRASLRARRALGTAPFDALFFHTQVTALLSVPLMRRVPSIISLDATPANYDAVGAAYSHKPSADGIERLKDALNRRSLRAAAALVAWSDWARRSLIDEYGVEDERISVIAPGVDLALWPRPAPKEGHGPTRLLFVGADLERKGGDLLLRAYRAALRDDCELHLVTKAAVGEAPGVRVYRDVAPNSDVLKQLYATADIFVLPTRADCFPLVIQEAMAAGLPVVSTAVGAISEAVRDGETGLLTPVGDGEALAAALARLAADPELRAAMGARGRCHAERYYDSAANARRILDLLAAIAPAQCRGAHS